MLRTAENSLLESGVSSIMEWYSKMPRGLNYWVYSDPNLRRIKIMSAIASMFAQSFFHGTKAYLKPGDMIAIGHQSNFTEGALSWAYFSATLDAAIWGAELAASSGSERIYVVEPTGAIEDDPNVTDKKFLGNPSMSYRSRDPLRIIAEVVNWEGHAPDKLKEMKDALAKMNANGTSNIID